MDGQKAKRPTEAQGQAPALSGLSPQLEGKIGAEEKRWAYRLTRVMAEKATGGLIECSRLEMADFVADLLRRLGFRAIVVPYGNRLYVSFSRSVKEGPKVSG